jgi:hypothetical protein
VTRDSPPDPDADQRRAFPEARAVHRAILSSPEEYPDGWVEQARFRERYDLPPFRPPRFEDGRRVREVVDELERQHGVEVSFAAYEVRDEGWLVEVDGRRAFPLVRRRSDAANVVFELTEAEFRDRVEAALRPREE